MAAQDFVRIQLLSDFQLVNLQKTIELPKSKKTRALLAYLVITGRPQRRERLCELFWEDAKDPKGALRWSLSQLKSLQSAVDLDIIEADRERVSAKIGNFSTDLAALLTANDVATASHEQLFEAIEASRHGLLSGLDLPNLPAFTEWLGGERARVDDLRSRLMSAYLDLAGPPIDSKLMVAREWLDLKPYNTAAAGAYLALLRQAGRLTELNTLSNDLRARFETAEIQFDPKEHVKSEPLSAEEASPLQKQKIRLCKTSNGITLAYAEVGEGPPLVKAANWLSHLELDWTAPIWSPLFRDLARDFRFIRYDERGNGLSDWDVSELSQSVFVRDLETVIDQFDYNRVPLLGISQGVAVCIDYAVAYPERVSKLVLFGGYPKGWRIDATPEVIASREAIMTLTRSGWGQENPAYRNIFSSTFMPSATPDQLSWFNDFQRQTTSPENAVRFLSAFADIDVRDKLSQVQAPTLIIHSRGDQRIDWAVGRDMAAAIPNAEFLTLESDNHLLLEDEPAADVFISAVREFLRN